MNEKSDLASLGLATVALPGQPPRPQRAFGPLWFALVLCIWAVAAPAADLYHHIDRATAFEAQGKNREAVIEWKNALRYDPNHLDARLALARLHIALGDGERAEHEIRRASSLGANANSVVSLLATALLVQGSFSQLIIELKPDSEPYGT
jgi:tetratricopeptide (TPR) repeat protein